MQERRNTDDDIYAADIKQEIIDTFNNISSKELQNISEVLLEEHKYMLELKETVLTL